MSSLRILLIAPEFPPGIGGMQSHAGETARRLSARGHLLRVLTSASNAPHTGSFPFEVQASIGRSPLGTRRTIRRSVQSFRPDVIFLLNSGIAPLIVGWRGEWPPIVVRTVGNDAYGAWCGPRHPLRFLFWRLPHTQPSSLGARLRRLDQERRVAEVLAALSSCHRVLCNSSYTAARLQALGVSDRVLQVLVGGVDCERFCPSATASAGLGGSYGEARLGIAGHLLPIKGIDVAIRMLPRLQSMGHAASLRIAGTGPEFDRLSALARSLGVEPRVKFLGNLSASALPDFYRDLDLYLQPSIEVLHPASWVPQAETMGRALCEASACGVPVIASRTGGIPDVVQEGVSGRLVEGGDPESLARVVADLLARPEERQRLGNGGRRSALQRFDWTVVMEATEDHLRAAASNRTIF